jgi:hypothetical protein
VKHIATLLLAIALGAQENSVPLIDLTNTVVQRRLREPATASAEGNAIAYTGRIEPSPPLALELISLKKQKSDGDVRWIVEVEVRNATKQELDRPVDPSSRDLEPASPSVPYRYLKASIWLAEEPEAKEKENVRTHSLLLYGAKSVPKSLRTLAPGQAVRIRARISATRLLAEAPASGNQNKSIRAFLAIFSESVTPEKDGRLHSRSEEVSPSISSATVLDVPR